MPYPDDLQYTKDHEWLRVEGNLVTVGITEFAQQQLGDVVFVELPKVGDPVKRGQPFGAVESTKAVSEVFSPVDGEVAQINTPLSDGPEVINQDPYRGGWLIKIQIRSEDALSDELLDAARYTELVNQTQH